MKNISFFRICSSLIIMMALASCGKSPSSKSSSPRSTLAQEEQAADGSNIDGPYRANWTTLNPHVNGTIPGGVTFMRKEDKLYAYVRIFAGGPRVWHQQHVYIGGRCPTLADDKNGDGYIDIVEAQAVLGQIIVPLDSDIGSQASGRRFFPLADLSGSYAYERVTSFRRFFSDLQGPDTDPNDNVTKIGENEGFSFVGKTVMIQGVAETIAFPETVASQGRYKPFQTLPIVCGVIDKVTETPGISDTGEIPGPVAPVIEGQDQPAPAGAGEYYPENPRDGGSGTNTNRTGETETGEGEETNNPSDYGNDET